MISIIICSRKKEIDEILKKNIENSIGCTHELIVIDNSKNQYSIFEAYNLGIKKSIGEYLCFLHDDIYMYSKGWGNTINKVFNERKEIGLLGVAGTQIKTKMPSAWWRCPEDQKRIHIIQHSQHAETITRYTGFSKNSLEEVVVIDGVFMAMRKDGNICFDTKIKGFHNYDLNISFEYIKHGYQIFVTNEILIEHFSAGSINKDWVESTFKIHNLYKSDLPLSIDKKDLGEAMEINNAKRFVNQCFKYKKIKMAIIVWMKLFYLNPFSKYHIKFWLILIKNTILVK